MVWVTQWASAGLKNRLVRPVVTSCLSLQLRPQRLLSQPGAIGFARDFQNNGALDQAIEEGHG